MVTVEMVKLYQLSAKTIFRGNGKISLPQLTVIRYFHWMTEWTNEAKTLHSFEKAEGKHSWTKYV